jgi:hypothetical protein
VFSSDSENEQDMNPAKGGVDTDDIEGMMTSEAATPNDLIVVRENDR